MMPLLKILLAGWLLVPPPVHTIAFSPADFAQFQKVETERRNYEVAYRKAAAIYRIYGCPSIYTDATARYAVVNGIPADLFAALVVVESSCRASAENEHAVGLCQIIPFWHHVSRHALLNPEVNLRVGGAILGRNIRKYGLEEGIGRYYGSQDDDENAAYTAHVYEVARRR
jgi:soluble lytic murein transglycosylase-like protein